MKTLSFIVVALFLPVLAFAQSGGSFDSGNMTFYNFGGTTGTSQQFGNMEFYNFSNGQSSTRQSFGNIDYYSSPAPSLNGSVQTFGNQSYGTWNDGTTSSHQRFGNMQFDTYQKGGRMTNCTSQRLGNQTYTNCQ
jgi:hypothetical protein